MMLKSVISVSLVLTLTSVLTLADTVTVKLGYPGSPRQLVVTVNGKTGGVCATGVTEAVAKVVCRQLGHDTDEATLTRRLRYEPYLSYVMSDVRCNGDEANLANCTYEAVDPKCYWSQYVYMTCGPGTEPGPTNITIAIKGGGRRGRLLATVDGGVAGIVKADYGAFLSDKIAKVICRELGWNVTRAILHKDYTKTTLPVVLSKVRCTGEESQLFDCTYQADLDEGYAIIVECLEMSIAIEGGGRKGALLITKNGETGLLCKDKATNVLAKVVCSELGWNTTWAHIMPLTTPPALPLVLNHSHCWMNTHKRLVDCLMRSHICSGAIGTGINCPSEPPEVTVAIEGGGPQGRLLVTMSGQTGTVCNNFKYDPEISEVVCRELGYNTTVPKTRYEPGQSPYIKMIGQVTCSGNETHFGDCDFTMPTACPPNIGVNCLPVPTTVKAAIEGGGPRGRLLAIVDGNVGTICLYRYSDMSGLLAVVCKELGWKANKKAKIYGVPRNPNVPVMLRNVMCTATKNSLSKCNYVVDNVCSYGDVEIDCKPVPKIKIEKGGRAGRLIVTVGHQEGTVCNTEATDALAVVACRQLGFNEPRARLKKALRNTTLPIVMNKVECTGEESDLYECKYKKYKTANNCSHSQDVAIVCGTGSVTVTVELDGGGSKGGLFATVDGKKGPVCNDGATHAIAKVVCRELGFNSSWPRIYPYPGPVYRYRYGYRYWYSFPQVSMLDEVRCAGNESSLAECKFTTTHNCVTSEEIGVDCSDEEGPASDVMFTRNSDDYLFVAINATEGHVRLFGATNDILVSACRKLGFNTATATTSLERSKRSEIYNVHCTGNENSITDCTFSSANDWLESMVTKLQCAPVPVAASAPHVPLDVSVAIEGYGPMGRLIATVNGRSGVIGVSVPSNAIATVVCQELGWDTPIAHLRKFTVNPLQRQVLGDVYCTGSEGKLAECVYTESPGTGRDYDLGIDCSPELSVTVAMAGGPGRGRLIAKVNGVSGYVCGKGVTDAVATVACRDLGRDGSRSRLAETLNKNYRRYVYWLPTVMHEVYCTGQETTLANCTFTIFGDCRGYGPAMINCDRASNVKVPLQLTSPKQVPLIYVLRNKRAVSSATESEYTITDFKRLADNARGLLLGNVNGKVGGVCYQGTEPKVVAQVICRQMGENTQRARLLETRDGRWNMRARVESCSGNETTLLDCSFGNHRTCRRKYGVAALCPAVPTFSIEGGGPRGRLIATVNLMPGTVCSSIANNALASVICRELGYNTDRAELIHLLKKKEMPIILDDAHCNGTEDKVADCRYEEAESSCYNEYSRRDEYPRYTNSAQDLEINCSPEPTTVTNVAIEGGGRKGRLLVTVDGKTGTVCNDRATHALAAVVCRELGLATTMARLTSVWSPTTLPIVMNEARCLGTENRLADCPFATVNDCSHIEDVGVDCSPVPTVSVALDGRRKGRLLATVNGKTGTVCDDKATHAVAKVVCRELGLNTTKPRLMRPWTSTTLPIVMDEVQCTGDENSLAECRFITNHNCKHSEDLAVRCPRSED